MAHQDRGGPRRLNLSLVISVLALVVATSSGAVAAGLITGADIKNESVTGKDVNDGSLALKELNKKARKQTTARPMWAIVDADGTFLRGNDIAGVTRLSEGVYIVTFDRPAINSAIHVSLINDGIGDGQINWRHCADVLSGLDGCTEVGSDPRSVLVNTEDSAGANEDNPYSISVAPARADFTPNAVGRAVHRGAAEGR